MIVSTCNLHQPLLSIEIAMFSSLQVFAQTFLEGMLRSLPSLLLVVLYRLQLCFELVVVGLRLPRAGRAYSQSDVIICYARALDQTS